jgi:hypothetical protein
VLLSALTSAEMRFSILACAVSLLAGTAQAADLPPTRRADGYRGVWYMNQPQADEFRFKYSGGFATYPQQHVPIAIYSREANKTFFCYGGQADDSDHVQDMVSFYDHATGEVPRPVVLLERKNNDAHCNPTLSLDDAGRVWVFCNFHGAGGNGYVYRSREPYSIDAFDLVREENFSYSNVWNVKGKGLLWLHTRYKDGRRRTFLSTISEDGKTWSEPSPVADMEMGSYQISWSDGAKVSVAFDVHPKPGGLNARTNLYYLETRDFGRTWTRADGDAVKLPLTKPDNAALVHDFRKDGLLVYLKDVAFDAAGHPVVVYVTSHGHESGPKGGPRFWNVARWTGNEWKLTPSLPADHNYDHGSLYIEPDGTWRLIAPTEAGPRPFTTGGQVTMQLSSDLGVHWKRVQTFDVFSNRNQTYLRKPVNANDDFYGFFADGDTLAPSESDLYFCTRAGNVFRLPRTMKGERAKPDRVAP